MRQHPNRLRIYLLTCLLPILLATVAHAQVEIYASFKLADGTYLQGDINGPDIGEAGMVKAIALQNVAFSEENSTTIGTATGGAGSGKATFNPLTMTKLVDKLSPTFFSTLTSGGHIDVMTLVFRKTVNGNKVTFMKMGFKLVFFTAISLAAESGQADLSENVTALYGAQQFTFYTISSQGTVVGQPNIQQWSQVTNQAEFEVQ